MYEGIIWRKRAAEDKGRIWRKRAAEVRLEDADEVGGCEGSYETENENGVMEEGS